MSSIATIFTDNALSPFNPMHVFLYTRRCLDQFSTGTRHSNDLYDITIDNEQTDKRLLFFKDKQQAVQTLHHEKLKSLDERLLTVKIYEQHALKKLFKLILFTEQFFDADNLNNTRTIVEKLINHNDRVINDFAIADAAFCVVHNCPSSIDTIISDYKNTSFSPLFLHSKHPQDAINILDEAIDSFEFIRQKQCSLIFGHYHQRKTVR